VWGYGVVLISLVALATINNWVEPIAQVLSIWLLLGVVFAGLGLWLTRSIFQLRRAFRSALA